jgi:hypothetical protein
MSSCIVSRDNGPYACRLIALVKKDLWYKNYIFQIFAYRVKSGSQNFKRLMRSIEFLMLYICLKVARAFLELLDFWFFLLPRFVLRKYAWCKICSSNIGFFVKKTFGAIRSRQQCLTLFSFLLHHMLYVLIIVKKISSFGRAVTEIFEFFFD